MIFEEKYSACRKDQKLIVSRESGNVHILRNHDSFSVFQFHVDGKIIKDSCEERCDYIVEAQKPPRLLAYVIELKGSDLNKALDQIESTIHMLGERLKGYQILPRVVIHKTMTHDIQGSRCRRFRKRYPDLVIKCVSLEEAIR